MSVSIVIPAYNASEFLAEALESALNQSLPASEVIVVDDGSSDSTAAVASGFGGRIRYVRQANSGVSAARNTGAAIASTPWLLFLDADDVLLPNALDVLMARAAVRRAGVVYGKTIHFGVDEAEGRIHGDCRSEEAVPAAAVANFWKSSIATPGAAIVRKQTFDAIGGFDTAFAGAEDRDLWLRAGMTEEFAFAPSAIVRKRRHKDNVCAATDHMIPEGLRVQLAFLAWCKARGLDTSFLKTSPAEVADAALNQCLARRIPRGLKRIVQIAEEAGITSAALTRARRYAALPSPALKLALTAREALHWTGRTFSLHASSPSATLK